MTHLLPALIKHAVLGCLISTLVVPVGTGIGLALAQSSASYVIIVHPSNPIQSLSRKQIKGIFLKKWVVWDHGEPISPGDLIAESLVRKEFTRDIYGKSVRSINSYWQKKIFSGRGAPPPYFSSEDELIEFVRANPGAVGYVSGKVLPEGIKVVEISD